MTRPVHLFSKWGKITRRVKGRDLYLFLDYDGTLAPIAETPDEAAMPESTAKALEKLSEMRGVKLAIVSGRSLRDITAKVGLKKVVYAGNHGFEMRGPGVRLCKAVPRGYRQKMTLLKNRLGKKLYEVKGVLLEDKGLSLSVHYRKVAKEDIAAVKAALRETLDVPEIRGEVKIRYAKMAVEISPPVEWDKGRAILWLLSRGNMRSGKMAREPFPVYVGDDATDEDAFRVLRSFGLTVVVGSRKGTSAEYFLRSAGEVGALLRKIRDLYGSAGKVCPCARQKKDI